MAITNKNLPTLYHIQVFTHVDSDTYDTVLNDGDIGKLQYEHEEDSAEYPYVTYSFKEWEMAASNNHRVALNPFEVRQIAPNITWSTIKKGCIYVRNVLDNRPLQLEAPKYGNRKSIKSSIIYNDYAFSFIYLDQSDVIHEVVCSNCPSVSVRLRPDIGGEYSTNFTATTEVWNQCSLTDMTVKSNFKMFPDFRSARKYLIDDDDSGELEPVGGGGGETPAEDRTTVLYYNDRVSVTTFGFNDTTDYFTHSIQFKIQYKTNAGEKITEPRNSIVGYVKSSVDTVTFSNIEWVYNNNVKIVECKWSYGLVGGTKHTGQIPPAGHIPDIMCFYDQAQIDNKVYKAKFGTNMVIFANKSDAERFAEGDKTVRPLYDGHSGRFDDTGDIGDKYSYNTQSYTIDNDMSSVWILTKEQLNELASVLATGLTKSEAESGQTLLNITKTTARSFTAQAEPVDMICDLFWVPIDVSEFCVTHTDHLQFGQDTYGAAGALDEFVDETTGQVVKAARTSSRSIEALTGGIFETIGSAVSDSKLNVRSESVTPPPSNT